MKQSELKLMIRQVVREEFQLAMKEMLIELRQSKKQVVENTSNKKNNKKEYSKNSILNDVLNETAAAEEWKTMGNYDSSNMNDILKHSYGDKSEDIVTDTAVKAGVKPEAVPEHLEKALTRDYREVMKATDEKAKSTRGRV